MILKLLAIQSSTIGRNNMELQGVLENAGFETRSYSGRGMMGKNCLSVAEDKITIVSGIFSLIS